jgi:5-methylthioadenosine/S-adenosylhomocysteine deaminase
VRRNKNKKFNHMPYLKLLNKLEKNLKKEKKAKEQKSIHSRYKIKKKNYKKILIKDIPFIFTCDKDNKLILKKKNSIEIEDGIITRVWRARNIDTSKYDLVYDASKRGGVVVTPGLINTHSHIHMYLLRSAMMLDEGEGIDEAIANMAVWQKNDTDELMAFSGVADLTEQQKNGITTTLTHGPSFEAGETAARATHHNLINAVSAVSNSRPSNTPEMVEKILKNKDKYYSIPAASLHYLYKTPLPILRKIKDLIDKYDSLLTFHMAESPFVVQETIKNHGVRETKLLEKAGLLNNRSIASHVLHVNKSEIKKMINNKVGIAHLPTSNTIHKSGIFPIWSFRDNEGGDLISLGTDSVISKNRLDVLTEAYQARLTHLFKRTLKFGTLFKMMTANGAKVLHMEDRGKIIPGMRADLAFWKLKDRGCIPYDEANPFTLIGNIITHNGRTVRDLMVNGEFIIKNRKHQLIDESKLLDAIQKRHMKMRRGKK